jgi:hypothetical protein
MKRRQWGRCHLTHKDKLIWKARLYALKQIELPFILIDYLTILHGYKLAQVRNE